MNFIILLFRLLYKGFIWFWYIVLEIVIFSLFYKELIRQDLSILAYILTALFVIWLIVDLAFKIVIRTGKSLIRYILNT